VRVRVAEAVGEVGSELQMARQSAKPLPLHCCCQYSWNVMSPPRAAAEIVIGSPGRSRRVAGHLFQFVELVPRVP
jgi:hypothetical protein